MFKNYKINPKIFLVFLILYLLIGFTYGMLGEIRMAVKYTGLWYNAFLHPLSSIILAPFWPYEMYIEYSIYGTILNRPLPEEPMDWPETNYQIRNY